MWAGGAVVHTNAGLHMSESAVPFVRDMVAMHLDEIRQLFVEGSKITVIVRQAGKPEQDFTLSDDQLDEAIAVLQRSKQRTPR